MPRKKPPAPEGDLLDILRARFLAHPERHESVSWEDVLARVQAQPRLLASLQHMESKGGEPDVIGRDEATGELVFCDCSAETPRGRTSCCYDQAGWESRKDHRPERNAVNWAAEMGVRLLREEEYLALQRLGEFDLKTSSWLWTPPEVRRLGGALFGDRRFGRTFIYHNGAQSYYSVRGFRGLLRI